MVVLLLAPLDPVQESKFPHQVDPVMYGKMKSAADILELSGPGDYWRQSFNAEINWCRFILKSSEGLPYINAAKCCPLSMKIIEDSLDFNRERRNWLLWDKAYYPEKAEEIDKQLEDVDKRYAEWLNAWQYRYRVDDCKSDMVLRRKGLQSLLQLTETLPCPVDVENYRRK